MWLGIFYNMRKRVNILCRFKQNKSFAFTSTAFSKSTPTSLVLALTLQANKSLIMIFPASQLGHLRALWLEASFFLTHPKQNKCTHVLATGCTITFWHNPHMTSSGTFWPSGVTTHSRAMPGITSRWWYNNDVIEARELCNSYQLRGFAVDKVVWDVGQLSHWANMFVMALKEV